MWKSQAGEITSPFNNKLDVFGNKIKKIVLQKQPIFLLNVEVTGWRDNFPIEQ